MIANQLGIQLYSLPHLLNKDFEGTLAQLAQVGYKELELAGPFPFSPDNIKSQWEANLGQRLGLTQYGYYGHTVKEVKEILQNCGLSTPSAHISLDTLRSNLDRVIEDAHILGIKYLVCPFFISGNIDNYRSIADLFNQIGEKCKTADLQFAYHNHSFEFGPIDGQVPIEVIIESTEEDLVKIELDLFWTKVAGVDPVAFFEKYTGRFKLCHVKDMIEEVPVNNSASLFMNPEELGKVLGKIANVGKGIVDFSTILKSAKQAGVEHFIVERDPTQPNAHEEELALVKESFQYLDKLEI